MMDKRVSGVSVNMFDLDVKSKKPKYEQIIEKIKNLIICKELKPDMKMFSIRALSKKIGVSPNTVQKSYDSLERQGYLYSIKGIGYYVAPIDATLIEERVEYELKPQFFRLLRLSKYHGLTKRDIIQWINEVLK